MKHEILRIFLFEALKERGLVSMQKAPRSNNWNLEPNPKYNPDSKKHDSDSLSDEDIPVQPEKNSNNTVLIDSERQNKKVKISV